MRQSPSPADEPHFFMRSLAIDYAAGGHEDSHTHPWPQFLYARSGAVRADIGGQYWTIPPRRGLWIPTGVAHRLRMSSNLQLRTLYIRPSMTSVQPVHVVSVSGLLHEAILEVCARGWLDDRIAIDRHLGALILHDLVRRDDTAMSLTRPGDRRAARLADMLTDRALNSAPLGALCLRAGLSRRTAERLFLAETGLAPSQWRRFAVLSEALVDIAGGVSIEHAAFAAGYQSRSAFSEAFARAFGFPPGAARDRPA
jgi:AraC-like DNA-binding protein